PGTARPIRARAPWPGIEAEESPLHRVLRDPGDVSQEGARRPVVTRESGGRQDPGQGDVMVETADRQSLAAIRAADVAGLSRLMSADERGAIAALDAGRSVFRTEIEASHGRVVDMAGDSVLAVFDSAIGAVSAAVAVQHRLDEASSSVAEDRPMPPPIP